MKFDDVILREIGALTRIIHAIIEIKYKELNLQKGQSIYTHKSMWKSEHHNERAVEALNGR